MKHFAGRPSSVTAVAPTGEQNCPNRTPRDRVGVDAGADRGGRAPGVPLFGTGSGSGFGIPGTTVPTGIATTVAVVVVVDETGLDVEVGAADPTVEVCPEPAGGDGFGPPESAF
jgi:hypothetical protein